MANKRVIEVQVTKEYSGGDPVWTNAAIYVVPEDSTTFALPMPGSTLVAVRRRIQDVFGNYSDWSDYSETTTAAGSDSLSSVVATEAVALDHEITETEIADDAISTPKLQANAVTAEKVLAGAITADKLAALLILASVIKTSEDGSRVEIDRTGIRAYDSSSNLTVNVPTDGSEIYVKGAIHTSGLVAEGTSSFVGDDHHISVASTLVVDESSAPAPIAPSVWSDWAGASFATPESALHCQGAYYDAVGGVSGATPCLVSVVRKSDGYNYVVEWDYSTRAIDRTTLVTGGVAFNGGLITRIGTSWYISARRNSDDKQVLLKVTRSTGAVSSSSVALDALVYVRDWGVSGYPITTDGTYLYVVGPTSDNNLAAFKFDSSLAWQSTLALTEPSPPSPYDGMAEHGSGAFVVANLGSGNHFYVGIHWDDAVLDPIHQIFEFDMTTGAATANSMFPAPALLTDLLWDGTNFRSVIRGSAPYAYTHTNWTWTTASPVYWVAVAWYDSAGTTHETAVGSRTGFTMERRKRLNVVGPGWLPGVGGADDPNGYRVYMEPNATDPGAGALKLQATTTGIGDTTLTTYDSGGAADGAGTPFPDFTPGSITDGNGLWLLDGSGIVEFDEAAIGAVNSWGAPTFMVDGVEVAGPTVLAGVISPTALSANTDNWNPTGLATASVVRMSEDGNYNLTGIVPPRDSALILLSNVSAYTITLKHDATSTAANRFYLPGATDLALTTRTTVFLWYDGTTDRWKVVGGSAGGGSATVDAVVNAGAKVAAYTFWR